MTMQERTLEPQAPAPVFPAEPRRSGRGWITAVVIVVLLVAGYAGYRWWTPGDQQNATTQPSTQPSKGIPVVVGHARKHNLPIYIDGLGTVTALNTVTVRTRVDCQLIKVNYTEGQFVKEGDVLAEIDPRPFQVQLEQAEGQLAKDEAQRRDAEANYERFQLLFKEGVIPKQQLDTQQAQVSQFDGAIKSDQAQIDNAKLQLNYCRITSPISGRVGLRLVDPGNIIHASDANGLLVITQIQPIAVVFSL